ncbi:MAG: alpha/beta hydrolase-fold protein [Planctomycetota bacterium]
MHASCLSSFRAAAWLLVGLVLMTGRVSALPLYPSFGAFLGEIDRIEAIADAGQRTAELDTFWNRLRAAGQVPYAQDGRVAMLYRGAASSIGFPGDANGWNPSAWSASQVLGTDLWLRQATLPNDARVDYKVVRSGTWILDPNNPNQQWSGFGPNSELHRPGYVFPAETLRDTLVPRGTLGGNVRLSSAELGADVNVRVYTPTGYDALDELPVVYVTDGHEYADDRLGAMVTVLDNLIADGSLRPTMAVFIDPRDPNSGFNRRTNQLGGGEKPEFADFIANELVPAIDGAYNTAADADSRVILGTSLGGLFSAFMGARHPDVIANVAIQSPAFWFDTSIYGTYNGNATLAEQLQIYMESGTINDGNGGPTMNAILAAGGYDYIYDEVNQGHSWGHWKGELDAALISLLGAAELIGDYDGDGLVGQADLNLVLLNWGTTALPDGWTAIDQFDDGFIGQNELNDVLLNWGDGAATPAAIPEPTSLGLMAISGIAVARRRRR